MATQPNTQGLYQHTTVTTLGDDTEHVVEVDKIQVNLFFDGTRNNYFNVTTTNQAVRNTHGGADTSYDNALSNVARMWESLDKDPDGPDFGVYVQGMGTTREQGDSTRGFAFGTGETGIESRAQQAFEPLKQIVEDKREQIGLPAMLELNVFGFSRGAATARHFVSLLRNRAEINKHFTNEWRKVHIQVNFVGLFDTVPSEGLVYGNDVDDLGLRFETDAARRVFHLVALDEYRRRFALTNIDSARRATTIEPVNGARVPMGFELGIPGAHSDVGGGYKSGTDTVEPPEQRDLPPTHTYVSQASGARQVVRGPQAFVYAQGWYGPQDRRGQWFRHQRQVRGDYYTVALSIMVDVAEAHTTTVYPVRFKALMVSQTPEVAEVQAQLRAVAKDKAFAPGGPTQVYWRLNEQVGQAQAQAFRHAYLHLSCVHDSLAHQPRYINDTDMEREYVSG